MVSDCLQDAVCIEYLFSPDDTHLHGYYLQMMEDLAVPASFLGISPTGRAAVVPKLEVTHLPLALCCRHGYPSS